MPNQKKDLRADAIFRIFGEAQRFANSKAENCLMPGCNRPAIASHSQSMELQLRSITVDNWVYAAQKNHYQTAKFGGDPLVKVRPRNASTFSGFCAEHDSTLFAPLERTPLRHGSREQSFLFYLRAISNEFASKRRALSWSEFITTKAADLIPEELVKYMEALAEGKRNFLSLDGPHALGRAWEAYSSNDFDFITSIWRVAYKNIGVSLGTAFCPLMERYESWMFANKGTPQPLSTVSIIPSATKSHILASWPVDQAQHAEWITFQTTSDEGLEQFINEIAFAESDDLCVCPTLWESFDRSEQIKVFQALMPNHLREGPVEIPHIVTLR